MLKKCESEPKVCMPNRQLAFFKARAGTKTTKVGRISETNSATLYKISRTRPRPSPTGQHLQPHPSNCSTALLDKIVRIS